MCGRITQYLSSDVYASYFEPDLSVLAAQGGAPNWNVAPGTRPLLMHRFAGDTLEIERVRWGYRPSWAADKGLPVAINARIEKAATGAFFRPLWRSGRAIVPANGWYEWTGEPRHKQPWYIHLKSGAPMFLAAITNHRPGKEEHEGTGFVLVTAAADGGMVDIHDRRPVVLAPEDAALWMDNSLPSEQAEHLARALSLAPEAFAWHPVGKEVNKVGNNHPGLIDAIDA
ncbi:MAG TPA: SOS response-associated peptidase [Paucimonas sp.]|nr:SOS response-associated peptidase [Paucimonas sp.]